jgi:hypothetical protein
MAEIDDFGDRIGDINKDAAELRGSLSSITRELNQIVRDSGNIADNFGITQDSNRKTLNIARELSRLSEKELIDKKEINQLESKTKELSKKIREDNVELSRLTSLRSNAQGDELEFLNKLIASKYEEKAVSEALLQDATSLLSISKEIKKQYDFEEFLKKIKNTIPVLSNLFSLGFFGKQALKASSQVTDLQKSLLVSRDEAYEIRDSFASIARNSGDTFITTDKLLKANTALSQQLGFSKNFGADLNQEFIYLTERLKISEEAAGGLAIASIATGHSLKSISEDAAGAVSSISAQYGIQLNIRDVLEEAGAASALMLANFQGNPIALVKGISQVKALGTSLNQVNKQANALLDFQTSIESQLNASLLTGQQINLERARELALNNNLSGLAEELVSQQIDYNGFLKLNRFQRDGIARAVGLESEELADQLLKIEYQNRSRTNTLALMGEEALKRAEALAAQDKFNTAIDKLSGLLGNLLDGPLGKVVDAMASIASNSTMIGAALGGLAFIQLTSLVTQLGRLGRQLKNIAILSTVVKGMSNPVAAITGLGIALTAGAILGSTLGGDEETSSISSAAGAARSSSNNNINQSTSTNELDYNKLAQSMSNVKLSANVRVNDLANPVTMYQQQNMRRSV